MKPMRLLFILPFLFSGAAQAQKMINTDQPVVFSKTVIAFVPSGTIPKTISIAPELQAPLKGAEGVKGSEEAAPAENETKAEDAPPLPALDEAKGKRTLTVLVRHEQIRLDSGIINNYILDDNNGVLTYFPQAEPRHLLAENIQRPVDILFLTDEGMVAQVVPEIIPAYLPDDVGTDFPLRALLYIRAGAAAEWGIGPGYRIEHDMFRPKPLIYMAPEAETKAITVE